MTFYLIWNLPSSRRVPLPADWFPNWRILRVPSPSESDPKWIKSNQLELNSIELYQFHRCPLRNLPVTWKRKEKWPECNSIRRRMKRIRTRHTVDDHLWTAFLHDLWPPTGRINLRLPYTTSGRITSGSTAPNFFNYKSKNERNATTTPSSDRIVN